MKKLLLLMMMVTLSMFVMPVAGQEGGAVMQVDFDSSTLNRVYQYNVYLPAGYDAATARYPVIYLLHGRGDTMDAWLNVRDALDELIANGDIPPLIAVMPDMPSSERAGYYVDSQYTGTQYPAEAVETAFRNDLIPHVDSTYRTLAQRESRLVGGYSMGGYGALRYAMAHPDMFSGALVLSPAVYVPLPPSDSSTREFGAFGIGDSLFDDEIYTSLNYPALSESLSASAQGLAMFIAVGDDEWKNPNPEDRLHDLDMEAHMVYNTVSRIPNVTSEFRVYDGGHDWDVWQRGFIEGLRYLMNFVDTGDDSTEARPIDGSLLGTVGEDYAGGIAADDEGIIYQALGASGAINGETHLGEMDVVLAKYAPDGGTLWTRQFGTPATERPYGVALDAQGGVIVAGYTSGDMDGQHPDNAGNDAFVARFNADGEQQWVLQFGDAAEADRAYALAVAEDAIYVGGYTKGVLEGENAGDKDIILARVSLDGEIQWIEQFGGEGEDKGLSVAVDGGMVYLSGVAGSALGEPQGDLDAFVTAYTSEGEQVWLQQFGSDGWDEGSSVTAANGVVYVVGFAAGDFEGHTLTGDKDIIVAAFDANGALIWSDQVGTSLNDKGADVQVDEAGNLYVIGFSDGALAGSAGAFDVVVMMYDANGVMVWARQIGTIGNDGADQYAEANLYLTIAGEGLLISGLTEGSIGGTAAFGSGDVFLTEVNLSGE